MPTKEELYADDIAAYRKSLVLGGLIEETIEEKVAIFIEELDDPPE